MAIGKSLSEQRTYLRLLAYGKPGTGKTTAGASLSKRGKVLIINAEGGVKSQPLAAQGCDIDNIEIWPENPDEITYASLEQVYIDLRTALRKDPDAYYGLVVDSMSELTRRLLEEVTRNASEKAARLGKNREQFQIDLADYGTLSSMMRTLLRRFTDLPLHVVLTALERRDTDDDGRVTYGPAISPAVANDANGLVDVVAYYTVQEIGSQDFRIGATRPTERRVAKDRFGMLPGKMVDATASRMVAYLEGKLDRETDKRQLAAKEAARGPMLDPDEMWSAAGDEQAQSPEQEQQRPARTRRSRTRADANGADATDNTESETE